MKFKKIGMVVAMRKEILPFIESSNVEIENETVGKYSVIYFKKDDKEIYIIESGAGEIFAAGATQLLISKYNVDAIINFGVCGSLTDSLSVLDVVLVDGIVHYDFDLSAIDDVKVGEYHGIGQVIPCKNNLVDLALKIKPELQKVLCASADKFVADEEKKNASEQLEQVLNRIRRGEISDFRMVIRNEQRTTHSDSTKLSGRAKELKDKGFYFLFYNPKGTMPGDVWDIMPEDTQRRKMHFAPYPEELCVIPIKSTCPQNGVVLDPFSGTGTTMKVAYELGRKSIGIDLSNEYIKLAKQRICQESESFLPFQ